MSELVFFSKKTKNTEKLSNKLGVKLDKEVFSINQYKTELDGFFLIFPTYGKGEVPIEVINFMKEHHPGCRGIIGCGQRNFGSDFAKGSETLSKVYGIPLIGKIELSGSPEEIDSLVERIKTFERNLTNGK